jgi:hypothetical protein
MWPIWGSRKPDGKRPLGRPRSTWEDNSKTAFKKYCAEVDRILVTGRRDRWRNLVNTVINLLIVQLREFFEYLWN